MRERAEWQEWDLRGMVVTQLRFDASLHVDLWTLERELLVTFTTPFTYAPPGGEPLTLDPEDRAALAPLLAVVFRPAASFAVSSDDRCVLLLEDGTALRSGPHAAYEAWESRGTGALASASWIAEIRAPAA